MRMSRGTVIRYGVFLILEIIITIVFRKNHINYLNQYEQSEDLIHIVLLIPSWLILHAKNYNFFCK